MNKRYKRVKYKNTHIHAVIDTQNKVLGRPKAVAVFTDDPKDSGGWVAESGRLRNQMKNYKTYKGWLKGVLKEYGE